MKKVARKVLPHRKWLDSFDKVSDWMEKYDLESVLDEGGGIAKIRNFFPDFVAKGLLDEIETFSENVWVDTAGKSNRAHDSVRHSFHSVKSHPLVHLVARTFSLLRPDSFSYTFSVARYGEGHHIVRHDDRAYADVMLDGGGVVKGEREVAIIYYLTRDWSECLGGTLLDLQVDPPTCLVPEFNSLVAFRIPRWHEVLPVKGPRWRYSVFGWFLGEVGTSENTKRLNAQAAKHDLHPPSTYLRSSQHGKKRSNSSSTDVSVGEVHPSAAARPAKWLREVGTSNKVAGMRGEFRVDDIS